MDSRKELGQSIGRARRRRGLTQVVLAGLIGRSESWLSQVERGQREIDSHAVLANLAEILGLSIDDLRVTEKGAGVRRYQAAEQIRAAMTSYDGLPAAIDPAAARRPEDLAWIRLELRAVNRLYQSTSYDSAGRRLPSLIAAVDQAALAVPAAKRREAQTLRSLVYHAATAALNRVGEVDLAWTAADRSIAAAQDAGQPLLVAVSAYRLAYVFGRREPAKALSLAARAAVALGPVLSRPHPVRLSLLGGLHLAAASAAAAMFERGELAEHLAQAGRAAAALGRDENHFWTAFGPTNVRIHEVSTAVKVGDPRRAIDVGEAIELDQLGDGLQGRRAQVRLDMARAYGQQKRDAAAVNTLLEAERISPELIRYDPRTADLLGTLVKREHRASTPELRALAHRAGVV